MKIDVQAGALTYGQRLELGKVLGGDGTDVDKFVGVFRVLYGEEVKPKDYIRRYAEFVEICDGIRYWVDAEQRLLHYEPTAEELRAGCRTLQTTELGAAIRLAKDFGCKPADIFAMAYSDVFAILWHNKEMADYEKRLAKIQREGVR